MEVNSPQRVNLALIPIPLPSQYLTEPQHVMELENKLELTNLELRLLAQKQLHSDVRVQPRAGR